MDLIIRPVDVWLFRDGRPFSAGEDHDARSIFPPTPFTLQGAIRTRVLIDKGLNPTNFARLRQPDPEIGYGDNFGSLTLSGPMLAYKKEDGEWERLIPMPADLIKTDKALIRLKPQKLPFNTNVPDKLELLWSKERKGKEKEKGGWLPESEWKNYLEGKGIERIIDNSELFTFESRIGIAIDPKRMTTQTQMLYRVNLIRLRDNVALWAKVDGVKVRNKQGLLKLGGENRGATYESIKPLPELSSYTSKLNKRFRVVLVSPAWFSGGWQPENGDWSRILKAKVRLVGVAIDRPAKFGGFDVAKNEPKPIRNFVQPGSVYFFEADDPTFIPKDISFTETPEEIRALNNGENAWAKIGLGKALIGIW